jgi:hypothetical protein
MADIRRPDPRRYVEGLLMWQGVAWLALATAGLILWIMTLPGEVTSASSGAGELWRGGELVAIAIGAGLGITEVTMACRMRGAPRLLLALGLGVQGETLGAGLVVIGISVLVAVSTVTLVA